VALNMSGVAGTEKAFAEFTKATGIEVEAIVVNSWTLWEEKATLMIATGQQLDLLRCDTGRAAQAALRGWLIPLSPLVALDNIDLSILPKPVIWHAPYNILLGMFGVDWVTPYVDRFLGATPEVVEAYSRLINLWLVDRVAPRTNESNGVAIERSNLSTQIRETGSWEFNVDPKQIDMAMAPLPWGTVPITRGGINSWGITSTCKDIEAAWEFVKYFTLGDGLLPWMEYMSKSPFLRRQYITYSIENIRTRMPNTDLSLMYEIGNYYWDTGIILSPAWDSIRPIFEGAVKKASAGEDPVSVAMSEVENAINKLLQESPLFK